MESLKRIYDFWGSRISQIPAADPIGEQLAEAVGAEKLKEYGSLVTIDNLVRTYPAYTHDDIFYLNLGLVYQLLAISKQRDYITAQTGNLRRQTAKK